MVINIKELQNSAEKIRLFWYDIKTEYYFLYKAMLKNESIPVKNILDDDRTDLTNCGYFLNLSIRNCHSKNLYTFIKHLKVTKELLKKIFSLSCCYGRLDFIDYFLINNVPFDIIDAIKKSLLTYDYLDITNKLKSIRKLTEEETIELLNYIDSIRNVSFDEITKMKNLIKSL